MGQYQLLLQFQLLLQLQLLPLLKPQLLQPSLLILSLCSLLLDNSNPSLLQMQDQFKLHSILMLQIRPVSGSVPAPQRAPAPAPAPAPAVQRIPQQPAVQRIPQQPAVQRVPAPQPVQSRPAAVPQRIVPSQPQQVQTRPVQSTPQLQFGFQPVSQGQQRPAPFTAFGGGAPRQRPVQQVQQRPVQLGVPPQRPAAALLNVPNLIADS